MLKNDLKMDWRGRVACRISSLAMLHFARRSEETFCTLRALCAWLAHLALSTSERITYWCWGQLSRKGFEF